jgi:DnaJ-class molecular chaperone
MTKRKPIPGPAIQCGPSRIGSQMLVACPKCKGFGAIMFDDGKWKSCEKCGGGGRVYAEMEVQDVPAQN